jgi:hypothetical protein
MNTSLFCSVSLALLVSLATVRAAPPIVTNVHASQRLGTGLVDIFYDATDADGDALVISAAVSFNSGTNYTDLARSLSGDIGLSVAQGINKHIVWDARGCDRKWRSGIYLM